MYVAKRPGCDNFLKQASENYELIIFTASVEAVRESLLRRLESHMLARWQYCSAVMEKIDPLGYVSHSLNRTHCTFYQNEIYVKVRPFRLSSASVNHVMRPQDLSRLGRALKDTILLDNNADCYLFQPDNAIPINSWYDDRSVNSHCSGGWSLSPALPYTGHRPG